MTGTQLDDAAGTSAAEPRGEQTVAHPALGPGVRPRHAMPGWRHTSTWIYSTMLISAILSLIASFVLSRDALVLAGNPDATFACDVNAVLSCSAVGASWQAAILGFPNAFLGMMCEPVVITIAVAGLAGVRFPRWFMFAAQCVYLVGLVFAYWLFVQSMWVIGALCPWCLVITVGTTLVFMTLLHHNILHDNLYLSRRWQDRALAFVRSDADTYLSVGWLLVLATLVLVKYGVLIFG